MADKILRLAEEWIKSSDSIDDIHINELDDQLKNKSQWFKTSIDLYSVLKSRFENTIYDTVLAIPLTVSYNQCDIPEFVDDSIIDDFTPPSFYLFIEKNEKIKETIEESIPLSININGYKVYYKECSEIEDGVAIYYRSIFVV